MSTVTTSQSSISSIRSMASAPAIRSGGATRIDPAAREEQLSRQLDERLSQRLAHIRKQISDATPQNPTPSEGLGQRVDIRA